MPHTQKHLRQALLYTSQSTMKMQANLNMTAWLSASCECYLGQARAHSFQQTVVTDTMSFEDPTPS